MKFERDDKYATIAAYAIGVAIFVIMCVVVFLNIGELKNGIDKVVQAVKPLIYAFIFAFMFHPLERVIVKKVLSFTERKRAHPRLRKILGIVLTYIIVISFTTIFMIIFVPQIINSYRDLQSGIVGYVDKAQRWIEDMTWKSRFFAEQYENIVNKLQEFIVNSYSFFENITPHVLSFMTGMLTETKNIVLGLIFSVYFLISKESMKYQGKKILRAFMPERVYEGIMRVMRLANVTFSEFIVWKALDSILIGMMCMVFMKLFSIPYAPLISLIIGVMNIVPFLGPFLGAIPSVFIIFISAPYKVIWFIIIVAGLQILDIALIEPKILSESNKLSSLWILISIIISGGIFGVVGLIIGVPLFTVMSVFIKEGTEKRLERKGMSVNTSDYYNK